MSDDNKLKNYFPTSGARSSANFSSKIKSDYERYKLALLMLSKPPNNKRKLEYSNILQDIEEKLTELEIARAKKEINKITQRDL